MTSFVSAYQPLSLGRAQQGSVAHAPKGYSSPFFKTGGNLAGFPDKLATRLGWSASDFATAPGEVPSYVVQLTEDEAAEVLTAVAAFKELNLPIAQVSKQNFYLPSSIVKKLETVSDEIHSGRGFAVIRGLKPKQMSSEDDTIAFCGLSSYIGSERFTSPFGMSMSHIRSAVNDPKPSNAGDDVVLNASKMAHKMKFHSDRFYGDILALHSRNLGDASSGKQYLASVETIYNTLRRISPETLAILSSAWSWPSVYSTPDLADAKEPEQGPVMFPPTEQGRIIAQLIYTPFTAHPEALNELQRGALTIVDAIAQSNAVELDRKEGDILYFNNLGLLHARSAFKDRDGRHMTRLALRDPEKMWRKPLGWEERFDEGFRKSVSEQTIPVEDYDAWVSTTADESNHG